MASQFDIVIVGSGPSGVQAAQTFVEAGIKVLMLDAGHYDKAGVDNIPSGNFMDLRRNDHEQEAYFLGKNFEGIPDANVKVGGQLTPSRKYVLKNVDQWLHSSSDDFIPMETLAKGGLGGAWGAGCCVYSAQEIEALGLPYDSMDASYQTVLNRIGVSQPGYAIAPYVLDSVSNPFEKLAPDANHQPLLAKYLKSKDKFDRMGISVGEAALAILTEDKKNRKKKVLDEMGFYSDRDHSVYRSWMTVDQLAKKENFSYRAGVLVHSFTETTNGVQLAVKILGSSTEELLYCKRVMFCCGPLGTARIVLRSQQSKNATLPILCNPYSYLTCIQPRRLGKKPDLNRTSFAQLSMFYDPKRDNFGPSMASLYSYRSLLLFRTLMETPLNTRDARIIMQALTPALTIAGIHHPDSGHQDRIVYLEPKSDSPTGDALRFDFKFTKPELDEFNARDKVMAKALRKMGCYPLKKLTPPIGASIHYAGTVPFSVEEKELTQALDGRLHGTKNVYIGDGSGFKYLPAKGLTFSLMANADRLARLLSNKING